MRVKMEKYEDENNTISISAPLSAFKMLKYNVTPIDEVMASNDKDLTEGQTMKLDPEYFGLQVLNPSNKMEMVDPTQIKTLLTGEQDENATVKIDGEIFKVKDVIDRYHKSISDRIEQKYLDKRNLIFTFDVDYAMDELHKSISENKITANLLNYLEYAQTSLKSSQSAAEIIDFFTYDEDTGQQNFQLNNPIVKAKFEQLFLSYFKSSLAEKVKGTSAALVSDTGVKVYRRVLSVDENGYPDKQEVIRSDAFLSEYSVSDLVQEKGRPLDFSDDNGFERLKLEVEASKGKGVIILDRLRTDMKEYDSKGEYTGVKYSESLFSAHDIDVMRHVADKKDAKIPLAVSKIFGVRIPSQDNHSAINIKVVDFLPAYYGSSIVSPRELVEVSGADFDIDKLYMQMKEFYFSNGEFIEYKDNFDDYVKYVNKKVQETGTIYAEANFKSKFGLDSSYTDAELKKYKDEGLNKNSINALGELGLPRTKAEYKEFVKKNGRPPYTAPLDNQILNDKWRLLGNEGVTESKDGNLPISYEPADIKVLTDLWEEIQEEFPELAELSNEDGLDADNMWGKTRSFANNQEGAGSIGAAVLPNLYLSLFSEYEVQFKSLEGVGSEATLEFNGITYDKYSNRTIKGRDYSREILEDGSAGHRKQYIISALITAMTDNAKERLAAKMGLNINALGVVANMTALGVPIKTSILLINNPIVRSIYDEAKMLDIRIDELLADKLGQLQGLYGEFSDSPPNTLQVNQALLSKSIKDPLPMFDSAYEFIQKVSDKDGLTEGFEDVPDMLERELSILSQFENAHRISEYTNAAREIINLSKGFGTSIADMTKVKESIKKLGLNLTNNEYEALNNINKPLIDVRRVFKGDGWHAKSLKVFNEFYDNLLPKVFLTQSKTFRKLINSVQTNATSFLKKEDKAKIELDLLSYLTIKAYFQNGLNRNSQSIASITNSLIYPQESGKSITDVVRETRDIWNEDTQGRFNYFLEEFIILEDADQKGNKVGIDIIGANTFNRLNEVQRISLQNGFKELFNNETTRDSAMKIIHYLMVKDGLQPAYKSLLSAINPYALSRYLGVIDNIQDSFAKDDDAAMMRTFGLSYNELVNDYVNNYFVSASASKFTQRVLLDGKNIYDPRAIVNTMPSSKLTRRNVENNPDTLYIVFDNENQVGTQFGRSIRGMENVIELTVSKGNDPSSPDNFYSGEESDNAVKNIQDAIAMIKEARLKYKKVVFPNQLLSKSHRKAIKSASAAFYGELKSQLKDEFDYRIEGETKKQKEASAKTINKKALSNAVYLDMGGSTVKLNIDIERGVGKSNKFGDEFFTLLKTKSQTTEVKNKVRSNAGQIAKTKLRTSFEVVKNEFKSVVKFPSIISIKIDNRVRYFQLSKVAGPVQQKGTISENNSMSLGTAAEYIEVPKVGSTAAFAGGFLAGSVPNSSSIQEYIAEVNSEEISDEMEDAPTADESDDMIEKRRIASLGNIEFDEATGELKSNGKIISKTTIEDAGDGTGSFSIEDVEDVEDSEDAPGDEINESSVNMIGKGKILIEDNDTEAITNFFNDLTQEQKAKLKQSSGITNVEGLLKEYKHPFYANLTMFLESMKQCFL